MENLAEETVEELLIRLPPSDPGTLVRAAAVCKLWFRIITSRGFRDRFGERHRAPRMLGFLANVESGRFFLARFVSTSPFRPLRAELSGCRALDARHGRVLLASEPSGEVLQVWDPVTDELREIPALELGEELDLQDRYAWNAAVLCAAHGKCSHLDCSAGPFRVYFLDSGTEHLRVHTYDSEADSWSGPAHGPPSSKFGVDPLPSALIGSDLWFLFDMKRGVVKYDLSTAEMTVIPLPEEHDCCCVVLTTTEDGGLGLARIHGSKVLRWYLKTDGPEGVPVWHDSGDIDLRELLPDVHLLSDSYIGFAHGFRIYIVGTTNGQSSYTVNTENNVTREEECCRKGRTHGVVPYIGVHKPGIQ